METYGSRLRSLRGKTSRKDFAQQLGISVASLMAYESDSRVPRDEVKARIRKLYRQEGLSFFTTEVHK